MAHEMTEDDMEKLARRIAALVAPLIRRQIDPAAIYSVASAAVLTDMHAETLREKLRAGVIQGKRRAGGVWKVRGSELLKMA